MFLLAGGTVDITAHEILSQGNVKEICPPSGGPWGGIEVDKSFISLMVRIFGCDFINHFKVVQPQQWLNFMTSFEKAKKGIKPRGNSDIRVQLPYSIDNELKEFNGENVEKVFRNSRNKDASFSNGLVVITHEKAMALFDNPVSQIVEHVKHLLENSKLADLKYILLVGGFAECKILQEAIRQAFSGSAEVLVPHEAQLAIIKGAVLFGHNPVKIKSRIARYTYGTESRVIFKEGVHDPAKKVQGKKGQARCKDHFSVFVKMGEEIKTGESKTFTYGLAFEDQELMHFDIFKTDKEDVLYIDESGVKKVGAAILTSSRGPLGKRVKTRVTFGHTELHIEATDATKDVNHDEDEFPMKISVDFLSE